MRICKILAALLLLASWIQAQENKSQRPSPTDRAELTLNDKKITIEYSRPKIRDPKTGQPRKIMGGLVPYGKVWRTGANEATALKTDTDLDVNGTAVPVGAYTLFTIPEPDHWTLIISKKIGEWGIPYPGESADFARVPMKVEHLEQIVDPFIITLEPPRPSQLPTLGVGGPMPARLCLAWENTKACVNLNLKQI
jgi:hypothetical protein